MKTTYKSFAEAREMLNHKKGSGKAEKTVIKLEIEMECGITGTKVLLDTLNGLSDPHMGSMFMHPPRYVKRKVKINTNLENNPPSGW